MIDLTRFETVDEAKVEIISLIDKHFDLRRKRNCLILTLKQYDGLFFDNWAKMLYEIRDEFIDIGIDIDININQDLKRIYIDFNS